MKQNRMWKISETSWGILVLFMVSGMLFFYQFGYSKEEKEDTVQEVASIGADTDLYEIDGYTAFNKSENDKSYLELPAEVTNDKISLQYHYLNQCIYLCIYQDEQEFYANGQTFMVQEEVEDVFYYRDATRDVFILVMDDVYECNFDIQENVLNLEFTLLRDQYDEIVVVDILTDSIENSMMAQNKCKNQLSELEQKIIFINHNEKSFSIEKLEKFVKATDADYLIQLLTTQKETEKGMIGFYQDKYYVNGFGSVELADTLTRNIVTEMSGTAIGLVEGSQENDMVSLVGAPCAALCMGSYADELEEQMLHSELFWEKVGIGLQKTILEAYEQKDATVQPKTGSLSKSFVMHK